ncbi:hypothetical protein [Microbacterium suwonense]|uniref:hypothetical protein n=1 Tax=Microbacterium suwonense TaxID=683047 RepID=UPI0033067CFB
MITSLTALRQRVLGVLGAISMYRLVFFALVALAVVALVFSFTDLVVPDAGRSWHPSLFSRPRSLRSTRSRSGSCACRGASSRRCSPRSSCCSCCSPR